MIFNFVKNYDKTELYSPIIYSQFPEFVKAEYILFLLSVQDGGKTSCVVLYCL